ncbi:MAG: tRNA (adenosine(37)-N6)-threonylcarbamoyltransferase complex ATPase subunit type 1 TsaE [Caldicoprobacterales bacterium]|jgi:tRNA threonylcarbamoyladenosine biosynthesis protein TsaE|nr:tRNA (adenosine(37)-N6)-threonylcarbamoyltransferase complex ATPase subunit type 1 TsaE [Clostridiales bacterium]
MLIWLTKSDEETYQLGKVIGENARPGDIFLLYGDLGSGKTVLSRGISHGAGYKGLVTSPTFTLMNIYEGRYPVYHFDIYRINYPEELYDLDYEEFFFGTGITIVEWSEKLGSLLPSEYLKITISQIAGENTRRIAVEPIGNKYIIWKELLKSNEGIGN